VYVGTIVASGPALAAHAEGTRVLGSFLIACGACPPCMARRFNFCTNRRALGLGQLTGDLDGAQAEYVRVPDADLNLKTMDGALSGLSNEEALFGGDVLTTGFYAAQISEAEPGERAVVIGAGPIGLFTAGALKGKVSQLVVLDTDPARVDFANSVLDFGEALLIEEDNAFPAIAEATDGALADVGFDAVGSVPAFKTAMRCVRDGGRVVVIGVYGAERYDFPMGRAWIRGLDIRFGGMANIHACWGDALMTVAKGDMDPTRLISHRLPLEEAVRGYELFASRAATKVVMTP
jgi:threonine dehydrogenase-like Zn-dependent dehydrogenase